jgi:hypothetical protein
MRRNLVSHYGFLKSLEQFALSRFAEVVSNHLSRGTIFHNQFAFCIRQKEVSDIESTSSVA